MRPHLLKRKNSAITVLNCQQLKRSQKKQPTYQPMLAKSYLALLFEQVTPIQKHNVHLLSLSLSLSLSHPLTPIPTNFHLLTCLSLTLTNENVEHFFRYICTHSTNTITSSSREGSITVWLTSCLTGLDLTKQVIMLLIQHKQSS